MTTTTSKKTAIIIGAGPAGLTAAYELLQRTDITPIILEKSGDIGGISKTVNYKGNRIDIGGHRFFSKSDRVMKWWLNIMPLPGEASNKFTVQYQNKSTEIQADQYRNSSGQNNDPDKVMLVRQRLSRIYFLRKFFSYPIQLSLDTLSKLGLLRTTAIMFSYVLAQLFPRKPEKNLEDFMINRFGKVLYRLFFKDYTEKVWGIPCNAISAEWGAQRIKGISITKALQHAVRSATKKQQKGGDIAQKDTETSLIEQFLYPKYGPGQLWEEVARQVEAMGGKILLHHDVKRIYTSDTMNEITAVAAINNITGETSYLEGEYFFSTMPVQELIGGLDGSIPDDVRHVASGLQYRDFITVGILLKRLSYQDKFTGEWKPLELKDTWIYIQEKDVTVGRLQVFNNWSPDMVKDPATTWIGMEFFCNKEEAFWNKPDEEIKRIAIEELEKIGLASSHNVLDSTVLKVEKTYPAYFGTYERFHVIRDFIDRFPNLFLVGRNGMHKYNNSDHSMLTAMVAVDNICAGITEKTNIWTINTEQEYHEEKSTPKTAEEEKGTIPAPADRRTGASSLQNMTFGAFLFRTPVNQWFAWTAPLSIAAQFIVFKFLYPYAGFINGDSYVYLETAYWNYDINTYPIGYSRFLRLFSVFTKSDTALVAFQYLSLQASSLYLLFTICYFYKPGKLVKTLLFGFIVFNPAYLYLANYVSSDALFIALSVTWFTQLIWILYMPTATVIVANSILLFIVFTIRYNALYYPLIAAIAFVLSKQRLLYKVAGFMLGLLLIGLFVQFTSTEFYKLTGRKQFSPFTGWQIANNAMYAYRYVNKAEHKPVPARFQQLDKVVRTYFDTTRNNLNHPEEKMEASTVYMWAPTAPLQNYMTHHTKDDSIERIVVKRWATMGPLYAEYGKYLILQYPLIFARHYLWPNSLKYYAPPVEFLDTYSTGVDSVNTIAQVWFGYKSNKLRTYFKDYKVNTLDYYPILSGVINVVFLCAIICFLVLQGYKQQPMLGGALLLSAGLWMVNFGFSVFASPIALRFQLFPILVSLCFGLLFIEFIWKAATSNK